MASVPEVLVVGSINLDLSVTVERFPEAGETVLGGSVLHGGGGKGANQAVAAARLGRRVAMVGRVGDDAAGPSLRAALEAEGIDVGSVLVSEGQASGLAIIEVDADGENRIVVAPGANATVSVADLEAAAPLVAEAPVILTQMEVPLGVVAALASMPRSGRLVVNPAPATPGYQAVGVDIIVPNRSELAWLLADGGAVDGDPGPVTEAGSVDEAVDQVLALADRAAGLEAAVVTLGGDGALVVDGLRSDSHRVVVVPAVPVEVVDTTAAGDSFCAGLADAICLGADVEEAVRWAVKVAAVTVTRRGAQASLPSRSDVLA